MAMEVMPPPGDVNQVPPPQQAVELPPGVYFNPGPEETVCNYLNRYIAGDEMPDTKGIIFRDNLYGDSPDVLRRRYPPGNTRNFEHKWFFFSECKFQSARGKRAERGVATGGFWRLEQTKKKLLVGGEFVGFRHCFGFYLGKENKTPWLMEQCTSCMDDGTGKAAVPVLCKIYVSPRASDEEKAAISGKEGVRIGHDAKKKTARVMVPTAYFDTVAALLPPSSVRGIAQGQGAEPAPPGDHGQLAEAAPPPMGVLGHCNGQLEETAPPPMGVIGHYNGQLAEAAPPPPGVLGQYQGQLAVDSPPPPPSSFHGLYQGQFAEAAASDSFSMLIDQFLEEVPQLTYGDNQGAQGTVMGYPETMDMDYPACQELSPPQLDPKGDYVMDVDMTCSAGAGVEQEPEPTAAPLLQESSYTDNGEQFTPHVKSKLDDGDVGELWASSFLDTPFELLDFDVSMIDEYLKDDV